MIMISFKSERMKRTLYDNGTQPVLKVLIFFFFFGKRLKVISFVTVLFI